MRASGEEVRIQAFEVERKVPGVEQLKKASVKNAVRPSGAKSL
jgi:hypothetical protein